MTTLRDKFQVLSASLKGQFLERDAVIDGLLLAALAGEHVLLVGAPGSAKSALVSSFTKAVTGASYFEWLLGRFTVPEELFGPLSLKALGEEKYKRVTVGKLPEAHVGFLDEVFKAGPAILNTLLPVMNERKFYNDGAPTTLPLRMMVGASNELPDGAELSALYDRFLVRFWVDYLESADNWVSMVLGTPPKSSAQISLSEWDAARKEAAAVTVSKQTAQELHKLRTAISKEASATLSDRRWKQCLGLLRAAAWLSGEAEVTEDHFTALAPALWDERGQIEPVRKACEQAAGAVVNGAAKIKLTILELIKGIPQVAAGAKPDSGTQDQMITANREGSRALAKLKELNINAKTARSKTATQQAIVDVQAALKPINMALRSGLDL